MINAILDDIRKRWTAICNTVVNFFQTWPRNNPVMSCLILALILVGVIAVFKK